MKLTPAILAAAYSYLRETLPFRRWKLPPADEVEFAVTAHRDREGDHTTYHRTLDHVIRISEHHIRTTQALMICMAHEMIHARQEREKTAPQRPGHNSEFKRLATRVCYEHGWKLEDFL